jgi:hypothetical protein
MLQAMTISPLTRRRERGTIVVFTLVTIFLLSTIVILVCLYILFPSNYRSANNAKWARARFVVFGTIYSIIVGLNLIACGRTVSLLKLITDGRVYKVLVRIQRASLTIAILSVGAVAVLCALPLRYPVMGFVDTPWCYTDVQFTAVRCGRFFSLFLVLTALRSLDVARIRKKRGTRTKVRSVFRSRRPNYVSA